MDSARRSFRGIAIVAVALLMALLGSHAAMAADPVVIDSASTSGSNGVINITLTDIPPVNITGSFTGCDGTTNSATQGEPGQSGSRSEPFNVPLNQSSTGYTVSVSLTATSDGSAVGSDSTFIGSCDTGGTPEPTLAPTEPPTVPPTVPPTIAPTQVATEPATIAPTEVPTQAPTQPAETPVATTPAATTQPTTQVTPPTCADGEYAPATRDAYDETKIIGYGDCVPADHTPESGGYTPSPVSTEAATQAPTQQASQPAGGETTGGPTSSSTPTTAPGIVPPSNNGGGGTSSSGSGTVTNPAQTNVQVSNSASSNVQTGNAAPAATPQGTLVGSAAGLPTAGAGTTAGGSSPFTLGSLILGAIILLVGAAWFKPRKAD